VAKNSNAQIVQRTRVIVLLPSAALLILPVSKPRTLTLLPIAGFQTRVAINRLKLSGHPRGEVFQLFFGFGRVRADRTEVEVIAYLALLDVNGMAGVKIGSVPVAGHGRVGSIVYAQFIEGLFGNGR